MALTDEGELSHMDELSALVRSMTADSGGIRRWWNGDGSPCEARRCILGRGHEGPHST